MIKDIEWKFAQLVTNMEQFSYRTKLATKIVGMGGSHAMVLQASQVPGSDTWKNKGPGRIEGTIAKNMGHWTFDQLTWRFIM